MGRRCGRELHVSLGDRLGRDEEGATLILVALSLIMLFGFAAIAVDGAMAWSQKRENQAAADTGALAGAQFVADKPEGQAMDDAETEVIRITYNTVEPDLTFDEWEAAWAGWLRRRQTRANSQPIFCARGPGPTAASAPLSVFLVRSRSPVSA